MNICQECLVEQSLSTIARSAFSVSSLQWGHSDWSTTLYTCSFFSESCVLTLICRVNIVQPQLVQAQSHQHQQHQQRQWHQKPRLCRSQTDAFQTTLQLILPAIFWTLQRCTQIGQPAQPNFPLRLAILPSVNWTCQPTRCTGVKQRKLVWAMEVTLPPWPTTTRTSSWAWTSRTATTSGWEASPGRLTNGPGPMTRIGIMISGRWVAEFRIFLNFLSRCFRTLPSVTDWSTSLLERLNYLCA